MQSCHQKIHQAIGQSDNAPSEIFVCCSVKNTMTSCDKNHVGTKNIKSSI